MDKRFPLFMMKGKEFKRIFNCSSPSSFDLIAYLTILLAFLTLLKTVASLINVS